MRKNGCVTSLLSILMGSNTLPDICNRVPPAALKFLNCFDSIGISSLLALNVLVLIQLTSAPVSNRLLTVNLLIVD